MIDKINTTRIQDILENSGHRPAGAAYTPKSDQADASLKIGFDSLRVKAAQIPQTNPAKLQKAREMLSSGQLESPENIRAAAENIVTLGI